MSKAHLSRLHNLPCVVCTEQGIEQTSQTIAHHIESIRDRDSDYAAIPLCQYHHQGSGQGVHDLSRRTFEMRYQMDELKQLRATIKALEKEGFLI